jgi:hypothetical protein
MGSWWRRGCHHSMAVLGVACKSLRPCSLIGCRFSTILHSTAFWGATTTQVGVVRWAGSVSTWMLHSINTEWNVLVARRGRWISTHGVQHPCSVSFSPAYPGTFIRFSPACMVSSGTFWWRRWWIALDRDCATTSRRFRVRHATLNQRRPSCRFLAAKWALQPLRSFSHLAMADTWPWDFFKGLE